MMAASKSSALKRAVRKATAYDFPVTITHTTPSYTPLTRAQVRARTFANGHSFDVSAVKDRTRRTLPGTIKGCAA